MGQSGAKWRTSQVTPIYKLTRPKMFIGEFRHNLDEKGRIQIPVKWRSRLAEGAIVTKGFDGSLSFFPKEVWEDKAANLAEAPQNDPKARAFVRQTLAGAMEVELDKAGRIILPSYLRQFASLNKQAILAGLYDHIEIWDDKAWEKAQENIDFNSAESIETLKEIGV